jgi:hypothetical protein
MQKVAVAGFDRTRLERQIVRKRPKKRHASPFPC